LSVWGDPPGAPRLWLRELHWDRLHRFLCAGESLWWHDEASGYALFNGVPQRYPPGCKRVGISPQQLEQNSLGAWAMDCIFSEITMRCMGGTAQRQYQHGPTTRTHVSSIMRSRNQWSAVSLGNLVEQVAQVFFLNGQYALLQCLAVSAARAAGHLNPADSLISIGQGLRRYGRRPPPSVWQPRGLLALAEAACIQIWHPPFAVPAWAYSDEAVCDRSSPARSRLPMQAVLPDASGSPCTSAGFTSERYRLGHGPVRDIARWDQVDERCRSQLEQELLRLRGDACLPCPGRDHIQARYQCLRRSRPVAPALPPR
jgi:hypothetical protein